MIDRSAIVSQRDLWESKKVRPIVQFGRITRMKDLPDVPTGRELVSDPADKEDLRKPGAAMPLGANRTVSTNVTFALLARDVLSLMCRSCAASRARTTFRSQ